MQPPVMETSIYFDPVKHGKTEIIMERRQLAIQFLDPMLGWWRYSLEMIVCLPCLFVMTSVNSAIREDTLASAQAWRCEVWLADLTEKLASAASSERKHVQYVVWMSPSHSSRHLEGGMSTVPKIRYVVYHQSSVVLPVVPDKAVAEVSKIGNL